MKAVLLNGWGQIFDTLSVIVPEEVKEITNLNYAKTEDFDELCSYITKQKMSCDVLIGWSLGGQLAVRLIEKKILKPKMLILIAAPYQFVSGGRISAAMNHLLFFAFRNAFAMFPAKTLEKFSEMVAENDSNIKLVIQNLGIDKNNHNNWVKWLDEIGHFSCEKIDFSDFPKTLIIHGDGDTIVDVRQAEIFSKKIKNSKLEIYNHSGHAPHLHDLEGTKKIISKCIAKL